MFRCRFCGRRVDPLSSEGGSFDVENDACSSCTRAIRRRGVTFLERQLARAAAQAPPCPLDEDDDDPLIQGEPDIP